MFLTYLDLTKRLDNSLRKKIKTLLTEIHIGGLRLVYFQLLSTTPGVVRFLPCIFQKTALLKINFTYLVLPPSTILQ